MQGTGRTANSSQLVRIGEGQIRPDFHLMQRLLATLSLLLLMPIVAGPKDDHTVPGTVRHPIAMAV